MKKLLKTIPKFPNSSLLKGISEEELHRVLHCLNAYAVSYQEGDVIQREGEPVRGFGILISGRIWIEQTDFWGNRNILSDLGPGECFGTAPIAGDLRLSTGTTCAAEDSIVVFLDLGKISSPCGNLCPCHTRLIRNLIEVLSERTDVLTQKMEHLSKRTTRRKLMSFLSHTAKTKHSNEFTIPFDRQALADYLFVDRSALSDELSKMQREGLIEFRKNKFSLKNTEHTKNT